MSKQDMIVSGNNWSVYFDKDANKLVCDVSGNELIESDFIDSGGMVAYCGECERFFDVRSGCETDIRADEREKLTKDVGLRI